MKKLLIIALIIFLAALVFKEFIRNNGVERFLDSHPSKINSAIEYYWGIGLNMINDVESSKYRFQRVITKYPEDEYVPLAWKEYINLLYDKNENQKVIEEGNKFLEKYPKHKFADLIRKKISFILNGI